jgi:hypothetical protein
MYTFTLPYERQGYSQFGETGIIELMLSGLRDPHRTFVEIGFGTGNQNMTMDLLDQGYTGVGVDGRDWEPDTPNRWGDAIVKLKQMITTEDIVDVLRPVSDWNCDFFSLDIDSFDYEVARVLLETGFKPAVVCVEINPYFGSTVEASFPYIPNVKKKTYDRRYFRGASLSKYTELFKKHGLEFFTLNSVSYHNAFYYDPARVTLPAVETITKVNQNHFDWLLQPETSSPDTVLYDDSELKKMISEHWFWKDYVNVIYRDFE